MLRSALSNIREYLTPVSHESKLIETGQITPNEFVQAGDYLVNMFPTWSWSGTDNRRSDINYRAFLPHEKQFLVSKRVPCVQRVRELYSANEECCVLGDNFGDGDSDGDGYYGDKNEHIGDITSEVTKNKKNVQIQNDQPGTIQSESDDDVNEATSNDIDAVLESLELDNTCDINDYDSDDDEILVGSGTQIQDSRRRYYDLYIAYSTSYRVPKFYLVGYNAQGTPLSPKEMFEDIATDYRNKTATIEKLPFYKNSFLSVSIHPCRHANVMKILLERASLAKQRKRLEEEEKGKQRTIGEGKSENENGNEEDWEDLKPDVDDALGVDRYLVIFLKFIASVTPGIEHDYTMEGW